MAYLAGLLSPAERKNSWQLAEITGDAHPYGFQHLLGRADWDPDASRDRLRAYVIEYLHAPDGRCFYHLLLNVAFPFSTPLLFTGMKRCVYDWVHTEAQTPAD